MAFQNERDTEIDQLAQKVVERLAAALTGAAGGGSGYHCTGSLFECGTYSCISAVHSCKDVYKCTIKFTDSVRAIG